MFLIIFEFQFYILSLELSLLIKVCFCISIKKYIDLADQKGYVKSSCNRFDIGKLINKR